jgi:hypothetical protein
MECDTCAIYGSLNERDTEMKKPARDVLPSVHPTLKDAQGAMSSWQDDDRSRGGDRLCLVNRLLQRPSK